MEYTSKINLFSVPLIHITTGKSENGVWKRGIARGWIAVGDIAFGILFSCGGVAIGGFSIGGLSLGIVAIAGFGVGVFALGGLVLGVYAIGGAAIALHASVGGFAAASKYAIGGLAIAEQANNALAESAIKGSCFFKAGEFLMKHSRWGLVLLFLPIVLNIRKKPGEKKL
ncbi:MAG: hypothetical protein WCV56_08190 [Candidatus Omnitrophota bacterium]